MARSQSDALETETICTLLSNETRRSVLCYLHTVERATTRELNRNATRLSDGAGTDVPHRSDRRAGIIALVHDHLPRLDAHGVIDYDRPEAEATLGPNFAAIEPFVERLE